MKNPLQQDIIADKDDNPPRSDDARAVVTLLCEVRQGIAAWQRARLEDISQHGFRIAWLPEFTLEKPVKVRIPGLHILTAHIRWHEDRALGCAFEAPLHIAVFENIVHQARTGRPLTRP